MKAAFQFIFLLFVWCSFILIVCGTLRLCSSIASFIADDGILYYLALAGLIGIVATVIPFGIILAREEKEKGLRVYQQRLLREADQRLLDPRHYSVFATPAFDRISVDTYHEMLSRLVKDGARVERPVLPGFAAD